MKVLGLQPTSADYYHRVGYSYDYLMNLEDFTWGGRHFGDVINMMIEGMAARQLLKDLGYDPRRADGTPKPSPLLLTLIFRHFHSRLDRNNLIDGLPPAEDRGLKPYDAATGRQLHRLAAGQGRRRQRARAPGLWRRHAAQRASLSDAPQRAAAGDSAQHPHVPRVAPDSERRAGAQPQVHEHQRQAGRVAVGSVSRAGRPCRRV